MSSFVLFVCARICVHVGCFRRLFHALMPFRADASDLGSGVRAGYRRGTGAGMFWVEIGSLCIFFLSVLSFLCGPICVVLSL